MKAITAIIMAISIGGVGGWFFNNQNNTSQNTKTEISEVPIANMDINTAEMPAAEDYVSLRPAISALPAENINEAELQGLLFMREEEKLARDVYITLYEKWGVKIFSNIAQSEQTHTEAVRNLLEKYNIADPVTDDSVGKFVNNDLQQLFSTLTERGLTSVEEAFQVGALIEDLDINDLKIELEKTDNEDIVLVYQNLTRGSKNHLRAFVSQITSRGGEYVPQYISQSEYNSIVSTEQEKGGMKSSNGSGSKNGRGWGNV